MLMMIRDRGRVATPPTRTGSLSEPAGWRGAEESAPRDGSAETSLLELPVDAVGEFVEPFVDTDFLRYHLLQRCRPFGRQIKEQRLRREVDLRTGRRDVMLLEISGVGFRDPVAELAILPYRRPHRI